MRESTYEPTAILGIARGGLPLATSLSARLKIRHVHAISITRTLSQEPYAAKARPTLRWRSFDRLDGERVLIADDIVGSGETLRFVQELVANCGADASECATLAQTVDADPAPRFSGLTVNGWVVFPWEHA